MGLFDTLNHLWSRADFWDKQENAQQDAAYAADQERKRREREAAQAAAQAKAAQVQRQQQQQQAKTVADITSSKDPSSLIPPSPTVPVLQRKELPAPQPAQVMNPLETAARSTGAAVSNFAGGLAGMAKGAVEFPSAIASITPTIKLGLSNLFRSKSQADRQRAQIQAINQDPIVQGYQKTVAPVQNVLTKAESATDVAAKTIAPWEQEWQKNLVKVLANIVPFDAAFSLASKGGKLGRAASLEERLANEGEQVTADTGVSGVANNSLEGVLNNRLAAETPAEPPRTVVPTEPVEVAPGIKSPNLTRQAQQEAALAASTPPVPAVETPVTPPTLPSLENVPTNEGAVPTGTSYQVPSVNTINPEVRKAVEDAVQQVVDDAVKPVPRAEVPATAPVETATKVASEEAPKVVAPPEVTTRAMTPEEMAAKGMTQEQIDAVMARRENPEAVVKSEPEPKVAPEVEAAKAEKARAEAQAAADAEAEQAPRLTTQAAKDAHEQARVDAVKRAEAETVAKAQAKTVTEPKVTPKPVEVSEKPAVPTKMELQKGARENTTQAGKVRKKWVDEQFNKGANPEDVRSAVEKVEGRKSPSATIKTKPTVEGGIPLSGEKGIGGGAESQGKIMDKTSKAVNVKQGKQKLARKGAYKFIDDIRTKLEADHNYAFNVEDRNAADELRKKFPAGSPEHDMLSDVVANVNQNAAQVLATANRVMRDTATKEELINRLIDRAKNIGYNLNQSDLEDVKASTERFIKRRSELNDAQEAYLADPTSAEKKAAALKAKDAKDLANKESKISELKAVASKEGDKAARQQMYKLIDKLGKEADVWQMDYVDTSLLSGSGTWVANGTNSFLGAIEEAALGRVGARIARAKTGTAIGAGNPFTRSAQRFGINNLRQEYRARQALPSKTAPGKLMNRFKNVITTINELGNTQIDAAAHASASAEYRNILKAEYPSKYGKDMTAEAKNELDNLVDYYAAVDPRDLRQKYTDFGYKVQGMSDLFGKGGKSRVASFENRMKDGLSRMLQSGAIPKSAADLSAKLVMRTMVGFPTIVARSAGQGVLRLSGGSITALRAVATDDPVEKAMLIKQAVKELGSGGAMVSAGYALGQSGLVTGAYPVDETTKDEWAKHGITEHSIKLGDSYYSIPRLFGAFAIPFMVGAQVGQSQAEGDQPFGDIGNTMLGIVQGIGAATPVSQLSDNLSTVDDILNGKAETVGKQSEKILGNMARILAPGSALLNEIAQSTSSTQKDTEAENPVEAILNRVYAGLPVLNQHLSDKTSKDGTVLKNTNPVARVFGAQSTENTDAVREDNVNSQQNNERIAPIIGDKNIYKLLDDKTKTLVDQANDPKREFKLNDQNYASINKAVAKTSEKLVEDGKWDSYGHVLQLKLSTQEKSLDTTEADKNLTRRRITQAGLLKSKNVEPEIYKMYTGFGEATGGGISNSEFHAMLDDTSDTYDPDTAAKLYALDKLFAEKGVSDNTSGADSWTRQKYTLPKDGGGKGGKSKQIATNFGTIGSVGSQSSGDQALKYESLKGYSSPIPNLAAQTAKTNLKKKISVTKGVAL